MKLSALLDSLFPYQLINSSNAGQQTAANLRSFDTIHIQSLEMDSRQVKEGSLFICLEGYRTDGHAYVQQAIERGAVAVLVQKRVEVPAGENVILIRVPDTRRALAVLADRFYNHPSHRLKVIGVTGTNGKTTITYLIEKLLEHQGFQTGRIGTIGVKIGSLLEPALNTTPESLSLQRAFAAMLNHGCQYAVMEASSHAIHMGRLRGTSMKTMIFSNLTQDHLDYHGTMDEYKRAKGLAFAQMGNRYDESLKVAVLNADDPAHEYYKQITPAQVLTYGIENEEADLRAKNLEMTSGGVRFTVTWLGEEEEFQLRLVGKFNVYNALAAIGAGLAERIPLAAMKGALAEVTVPGRLEAVDEGQPFQVLVDYAHTPDSLANVLRSVREFADSRVICLVGCGGDRDRTKRPLMARIAAAQSDLVILTSDNPRSEDPEQIIHQMEQGLIEAKVPQTRYMKITDRRQAIERAIREARPEDIIVLAGKGHETYQEINGETLHFDDREVAREVLRSIQQQSG
jgi:UDP-N-acetylmuramoyl-L-alanyl-D-glutamate--2,6-diaminopimelate ligase